MSYLPQEIAKDVHNSYGNDVWGYMKGSFQTQLPLFKEAISEWDKDEFERFVVSMNFCNPEYTGKFAPINRLAIATFDAQFAAAQTKMEFATTITDARDFIFSALLVADWMDNKQVYRPDKDFVDMLIHTKNFKLHIDQLRSLPYTDLCFDFSACPDLAPIEAAFLSFRFVDDNVFVINYLMSKNKNLFSFYYGAKVKDGYIELGKMSLDNMLPADDEYRISPEYSTTNKEERYKYKYTRKQISEIMLQLVGYLTCQNVEVKQSQRSKKTHKNHPANYTPKNDISEFTEYEIGVKIGKTIRKCAELGITDTDKDEPETTATGNSRKGGTKSPHVRGAHWHHYWTGEGRTELIVKWIPPTYINKDKPNKDIVVHRMAK